MQFVNSSILLIGNCMWIQWIQFINNSQKSSHGLIDYLDERLFNL